MVSWCSWLSRQSNTLKVSGSNPGEANEDILFVFFDFHFGHHVSPLFFFFFLNNHELLIFLLSFSDYECHILII